MRPEMLVQTPERKRKNAVRWAYEMGFSERPGENLWGTDGGTWPSEMNMYRYLWMDPQIMGC